MVMESMFIKQNRIMREIKFRAKRLDNGEWVYGAYFCLHHNDERNHIHHFIIPDNAPIPKEKAIGEIQVEIIPETLGQYTGLKDRNGKEIYDGDIVRCVSELFSNVGRFATGRFATEHYEICSLDGDYSYCFGTKKIGKDYISKDILKSNAESFYEIIGNIYDDTKQKERGGVNEI